MPITKSGKKVLKAMGKTYGKKKGEDVFYSSINARKKGSAKWHGKEKTTKEQRRYRDEISDFAAMRNKQRETKIGRR